MRICCLCLALLVGPSLGAEPPKASEIKEALKPFQGVWLIRLVEKDGTQVRGNDDAKMIFENDKFTTKVGTQIQEGTFKVENGKGQNRIDMVVMSGIGKGDTYRGIYKFVDDELLLCFPKDTNAERPKEISGNAGNGQVLTILRKKN